MALFRTAQRKSSPRAREDRTLVALDRMTGLCGTWTGARWDHDPDQREATSGSDTIRRSFRVDFELDAEGTHVIARNDVSGRRRRNQNFDVWGRDAPTGDLFRTTFADGVRQTNIYDISRLDLGRDPKTWHLVLETVSWDEARPCEIRYEISRARNQLDLTLTRRLIAHGADYELVSSACLTRAR